MKRLCFAVATLVIALLSARADTTLVFNEIMYHPATNEPALEWVELYNQMTVDLDVGGWRITGDIGYTFPANARIAGRGYLVVAINPPALLAATGQTNIVGPFTNRLSNGGGTLNLRNNNGRIVDSVSYGTEGAWSVAPDGAGVSLAKRDRDFGSSKAANWTVSEQIGGTPGIDNFPGAGSPAIGLVGIEAAWKYEASGGDLGTAWRALGFDDGAWSQRHGLTNRTITDLFNTGVDNSGVSLADGAADPHYVLGYTAQGPVGANATVCLNNAAWSANDTISKWISVVPSGATTINGGGYGYKTTFSLAGFLLGTVKVNFSVAIDNAMTNVFLNGVAQNSAFTGFASFSSPFTLSSGFNNGVNTLEFGTENQGAGPGAFRALVNGSGLALNTDSPLPLGRSTYYFRRSFIFNGNPHATSLALNTLVADGAVFYLNGVEVYRQNLPAGTISYGTPALSDTTTPAYSGMMTINASNLVSGVNVLAVEVHQATGSADGPVFGAEVNYTPQLLPPTPLQFNELSASTNGSFWIELMNYGTNPIALTGLTIRHDSGATNNDYVIPSGTTLNGGAFLAITNDLLAFLPQSGDKLYLYSSNRFAVYDGVVVKKGPRARSPNGTGDWLIPNAPTPGTPNIFALHNEIVINEIMYHHKLLPQVETNVPPQDNHEQWIELYNRSGNPVNLTGWEFTDGIQYKFASNKIIAAGAYLLVTPDAVGLRAKYPALDIVGDFGGSLSHGDDHLVLSDDVGNPADEVHYYTSGRWPEYADGGGTSLELRDPDADNSKPEAWAASDESSASSWQTYSYRAVAAPSVTASPDAQWREFVFGLLSSGECLIDDISVIESPGVSPVAYVGNGNFENGLTGWRVLGTHVRSAVEPEPGNPGNHVLHVIATGAQEHMHNHIETTLLNSRTVNNGQTYEVSFRAKWLAGNSLLNTRLYFNRVARTTELIAPQNNGTPGAQNSRYEPNIGPTFARFQHSPIVPQVNQPVTVSVAATDPDGVAACQLFWSVNGGAFSSVAMTSSGGVYFGVIPGGAAASVVQFYVQATDGLGAVSTFPASGANSGALYKVFDGLANLPLAHNIRILMTPANTALLHADTNVMSNDTLPCTVIYNERIAYYDMAVHLKSSERGRNDGARVGFHLVFPPDNLFRGVHPVMLVDRSGGGGRPTAEEIVLRHMALKAGVPAVNADLIRVLAPQAAQNGAAIFAPRFEDEFIETAYDKGGDGTFFEMELIYYPTTANAAGYKLPQPDAVQGLDISDVGNFKETYRYNFIIKNHRGEDDYSQFIAFAKPWSLTGAALDAQTQELMDIDEWMKAYAIVSLCGVGDMYTFGNNHNQMNYIRGDNHRAIYLPWDMDFSFTRANNAPLVGDQNLAKIVNLPNNLRVFYAYVLDQIDTTFNVAYMNYWLAHYGAISGQSYLADAAYIQARGDFARSTIASGGGLNPFSIASTNVTVNGSNFVTFTGIAPVTMKTITVNGVAYPITWTSLNTWTLKLPLSMATNQLQFAGLDLRGNVLTNMNATALFNGTPESPVGKLFINELMYRSLVPDGEYVELFNSASNVTFDLSGWRVNGLDYTFPAGSYILPRAFLVLAKNRSVFAATYGNAVRVFDEYDGDFQRDGETISLVQPGAGVGGSDLVVDRVRYEGGLPWPAEANGTGSSYQLIDPSQDNARVGNWFSSFVPAVFSPAISTPEGARDGWRFFRASGNTAGGASQRLMFFLGEIGSALIDDVSVVLGTNAAVGSNYVRNGDFESPLIDEPPLANSWILGSVNYTNSLIVHDLVHSGNGALKIVGTAPGVAANPFTRVIYQFVEGLPASTSATLSFWYWATNSATNLYSRILNSSGLATGAANAATNINIFITPTNYVPPTLLSPATNALSPGAANTSLASLPVFPPLWINELQAENLTGLLDAYGEHEPWIEIYNTSSNTVSLEGLYLSANYNNLTNWAFPSGSSIGPAQFLVIFCDGQSAQTSNTEYHTSFRLSASSGAVVLSRWYNDAPQVLDYVNYAGLHSERSYGSFPDGQPFDRQEFFYVTPRGTNDGRSAPLVVFINEWMAANAETLDDPADGDFEDWFELYNPAAAPVDLAGYYLTDTLTNKFKYLITTNGPHIIPAQGHLLVWADNETGQNLAAGQPRPDLHVNFQLAAAAEAIGLFGADGAPIDTISFTNQTNDVSQGRFPDGSANIVLMPGTASPRAANYLPGFFNTAPVLDPIGSKIIYLGETLTFTATATDADVPAQVLGFTLDPTPPAGASITPAGLFTWTPAVQGTNAITLRVIDNGVPSKSATETFTVEVVGGPRFTSGIHHGTDLELVWRTRPGQKYAIDYKANLNAAQWTPLWTNTAAGDSLSFTNNTTGAPQGFFRIRNVP